jgi:hypothetical protein
LSSTLRHWFTGTAEELPWDEGRPQYDPLAPFVCDRPSADVLAYYRDQCRRADEVLAVTPLSATPLGAHPDPSVQVTNVQWIVLHLIEETAVHSGHLEIARELLDGRTRLAGR